MMRVLSVAGPGWTRAFASILAVALLCTCELPALPDRRIRCGAEWICPPEMSCGLDGRCYAEQHAPETQCAELAQDAAVAGIEAEDATLAAGGPGLQVHDEPPGYRGRGALWVDAAAATSDSLGGTSRAAFRLQAARDGSYSLWVRAYVPSEEPASVRLTMRSPASETHVDIGGFAPLTWSWSNSTVDAAAAVFELTRAMTRLELSAATGLVIVDRILLAADPREEPLGQGPPADAMLSCDRTAVCGDALCGPDEDCSSCAEDCGACRFPQGRDFFAAPGGRASGAGTESDPWDLASAVTTATIGPGDTLWLLGGAYGNGASPIDVRFAGEAGRPVVIRGRGRERVVIDGGIVNHGPHVWYWGLELTTTDDARRRFAAGIASAGDSTGLKIIHTKSHDLLYGAATDETARAAEIYGTVSLFNGMPGAAAGSSGAGLAVVRSPGPVRVTDNVAVHQCGVGLYLLPPAGATYAVEGNVAAASGAGCNGAQNVLVTSALEGGSLRYVANETYSEATGGGVSLGWSYAGNLDALEAWDNSNVGGQYTTEVSNWRTVTFHDNRGYSDSVQVGLRPRAGGPEPLAGYAWDGNAYFGRDDFRLVDFATNIGFTGWTQRSGLDATSSLDGVSPSGTWLQVRPSSYERGRAMLVIYNWDLADTIRVDVTAVIPVGATFAIFDTQSLAGAPLVTATYDGAPVTVPMSGLVASAPSGRAPPPHTAPRFGVFWLQVTP